MAGPPIQDAALVAVCLALTGLAVKTPWSPLPAAVIAGAGVAGSAVQWWRRRRPRLATIAGAMAYALSGNPGPLLVGLYSGTAYAPRRQVVALGLVGAAGIAAYAWIDAGRLTLADAAWAVLGATAVAMVGAFVAAQRALRVAWRERERMAEQQARSDERARIAAEMHDVLAHKVSLIALHAGALELTAGASEPRVGEGAALIRTTAREALQELRQVLGMLRTDLDLGSPPDLSALVAESVHAGQTVELRDDAGTLPAALARVVYRVAQEGLTNARKHAPDAPTTVTVERDGRGIVVTVANGASAARTDLPGSGSGLIGLAERVHLMGGRLQSGPQPGGGWCLRAELPEVAA